MKATITILNSDLINLQQIITHRLSLDEFDVGLRAMREGKALEVVIYPGGVPK